jgi:ATP-dependent phosphoenolpyruvate carboxykinase
LDEMNAQLMAARQSAGEARQLVAGALQGSSGQLTAQLDALVEALGQMAGRTPKTKEQVRTTIAKVQALGN